jgi:hypothetical protein
VRLLGPTDPTRKQGRPGRETGPHW